MHYEQARERTCHDTIHKTTQLLLLHIQIPF